MTNIKEKKEKSSRWLDNYYNPNVHEQNWKIIGKYKNKKKYTYGDTGWGFNVSKVNKNDNIIPFDDNSNKMLKNNKTSNKSYRKVLPIKKYVEYDYCEENEIIITIEHCSHCIMHLNHTNHVNNVYMDFAKNIQKCILIRYPFTRVYLKPVIEEEICSRLGAMEIQLASKYKDANNKDEDSQVNVVKIFSKLETGVFPSISNIWNKIRTYLPWFTLNWNVFDKEEDMNNNDNNQTFNNKIQNILVNWYWYKSDQISEWGLSSMKSIDMIVDPKKRQNTYLDESTNWFERPQFNNTSTLSEFKLSSRPETSKTARQFPSMMSTSNRSTYSNNNRSMFPSTIKIRNELNYIQDSDVWAKVKGKFLCCGYTDENGKLTFKNVPYDSYIVEIANNKNFMKCGCWISPVKISSEEISKNIGLFRQVDAFLEVFIYSEIKEEIENMELITNSEVTIKYKFDPNLKYLCFEEDSLPLKENEKIRGRYEIITSPGIVELNVFKEGYENIRKEIELKPGDNKINIQLK